MFGLFDGPPWNRPNCSASISTKRKNAEAMRKEISKHIEALQFHSLRPLDSSKVVNYTRGYQGPRGSEVIVTSIQPEAKVDLDPPVPAGWTLEAPDRTGGMPGFGRDHKSA